MEVVVLSLNVLKLCLVIVCVAVLLVSAETIVCLRSHRKQCIQGVDKVTSFMTKYEAFMGIPYAKPPIGLLRFANPVPSDPWTGVYDATHPKPACVQRNEILPLGDVFGVEDCLYLNVYRPKNAANNLPVMVYIHGGAFQSGSADPTVSGPGRLMNSREVILVTISYRLGVFGFLSTGDSVAPGNFGFKDQSMGIRWVRKHIHKFGGNSQLITVFGESAGGAATHLHMMSPLSRGNFSRAIMMSGSALAFFFLPNLDPLRTARLQAGVLGLTPSDTLTSSQVITFLRGIPALQLVSSLDAVKQMVGFADKLSVYRLVIEQYVEGQSFLHESPLTLWASGNYEQIPWMAGHVPNEWICFAKMLHGTASNPSQGISFLTQGPSVLAQTLGLDLTEVSALLLRYFGTIDLTSLSTSEVINLAHNLLADVHFEYPMRKSVAQHLQHSNPLNAPVSVYFMNFTGPYSILSFYLPDSSLSIGHTDDLQYVLSRPALFPEFAFGSPGYLMAARMVKLFVEFARTGRALPSFLGTCPSVTQCKQIEFSNDQPGFDPVQVQLTSATNSDLMNFWDGVYNTH